MFLQVGREGRMPKRRYVTSWNENGLRCLTACSTLDRLLFDTNIVEQEPDLYTYLYHSKNHRCVEKYQQFPDHCTATNSKPLTLYFLAMAGH